MNVSNVIRDIKTFLAHLSRKLTSRAYSITVEPASVRACVRRSVRASVNTFKHEYICNQLADWNESLSEASLGWGKGFTVDFDPDWIRTLVSMATDSSHIVIMGKTASSRFLECF